MSLKDRWLRALKPDSWPKLTVPMTLGMAAGVSTGGGLDPFSGIVGFAMTSCLLGFIVLTNDWADQDVDGIKRRMFPKSSVKTIPDGLLSARSVLLGGLVCAAGVVGVGFGGGWWVGRPLFGWLSVACLALFALYSLPPFKLNYRGGGELLEMLGIGVFLPAVNAYLMGGEYGVKRLLWLAPGFALLALASAIASGLSDEQSDKKGGKVTFVTMLGNGRARAAIEALVLFGAVAWAVVGVLHPKFAIWVTAAPLVPIAWYWFRMKRDSGRARTNAFEAQRSYKGFLHLAIWRGARTLSAALVIHMFLR